MIMNFALLAVLGFGACSPDLEMLQNEVNVDVSTQEDLFRRNMCGGNEDRVVLPCNDAHVCGNAFPPFSPCVFPFRYPRYTSGNLRNDCITDGHNAPWCYTTADYSQWGNCAPCKAQRTTTTTTTTLIWDWDISTNRLKCPPEFPWAFRPVLGLDGCCKHEKDWLGIPINSKLDKTKRSETCWQNHWRECPHPPCTDHAAITYEYCPLSHPWAYRPSRQFDYCCATRSDSGGTDMGDWGETRPDSCLNNDHMRCPKTASSTIPCKDYPGYRKVGDGCAGVIGGVASERWLDTFHLGVQGCYEAVMADDDCAKDYFNYVERGDKNCGCKIQGPLVVRHADCEITDFYRIEYAETLVGSLIPSLGIGEYRANSHTERGMGICTKPVGIRAFNGDGDNPGDHSDQRGKCAEACFTGARHAMAVIDVPYGGHSMSSIWGTGSAGTGHFQGRLDSPQAWSSQTTVGQQWYGLDLGAVFSITGVATKGRADIDQWVSSYTVKVSQDDTNWHWQDGGAVFTGNTDRHTLVAGMFNHAVDARYVRIYPQTFHAHMSMRAGIYGVAATMEICPVSHPYAYHTNYAWCCSTNREKNHAPSGAACDGSPFGEGGVYSTCCDGEHVRCLSPPCFSNAESVNNYAETDVGSRDCPTGFEPIPDEATCKRAQVALGKTWDRTYAWPNIQPGCFSHPNMKTWWNTNNAGTTHGSFTSVCKVAAQYAETSYGSRDCPTGFEPIPDEATCKQAQVALGKTWDKTDTWHNIQPGCFSHPNMNTWWNTNNAGTTHGSFASVCKKALETCVRKTFDGVACRTSFEFRGTTYNECTMAGHDVEWCYTSSGAWGNCAPCTAADFAEAPAAVDERANDAQNLYVKGFGLTTTGRCYCNHEEYASASCKVGKMADYSSYDYVPMRPLCPLGYAPISDEHNCEKAQQVMPSKTRFNRGTDRNKQPGCISYLGQSNVVFNEAAEGPPSPTYSTMCQATPESIIIGITEASKCEYRVKACYGEDRSCGTANMGDLCQMPFEYNGRTHTSCIMDDWHRPWCYTNIPSGNGYTWGECFSCGAADVPAFPPEPSPILWAGCQYIMPPLAESVFGFNAGTCTVNGEMCEIRGKITRPIIPGRGISYTMTGAIRFGCNDCKCAPMGGWLGFAVNMRLFRSEVCFGAVACLRIIVTASIGITVGGYLQTRYNTGDRMALFVAITGTLTFTGDIASFSVELQGRMTIGNIHVDPDKQDEAGRKTVALTCYVTFGLDVLGITFEVRFQLPLGGEWEIPGPISNQRVRDMVAASGLTFTTPEWMAEQANLTFTTTDWMVDQVEEAYGIRIR